MRYIVPGDAIKLDLERENCAVLTIAAQTANSIHIRVAFNAVTRYILVILRVPGVLHCTAFGFLVTWGSLPCKSFQDAVQVECWLPQIKFYSKSMAHRDLRPPLEPCGPTAAGEDQ